MSLLERFRAWNRATNERVFGDAADSFRPYLDLVAAAVPDGGRVVDLGAGEVSLGQYLPELARRGVRVVALDGCLPALAKNRTRDRIAGDGGRLPLRDESVDLVTASCSFEHVERPAAVLGECYRVLKQGGSLIFYTPHRRSYVAVLARVTPMAVHRWVRRMQTGLGADAIEVVPTYYRMNTVRAIERLRGEFALRGVETWVGAPSYTVFLPPPLHWPFVAWHLLLLRIGCLRRMWGESLVGRLVRTLPARRGREI